MVKGAYVFSVAALYTLFSTVEKAKVQRAAMQLSFTVFVSSVNM
jgi:hypothetical protein